jgi:GT2 family glycosyltransferase
MPMEVIVIDNGSSDGSPNMVQTDFPEVDLIVNKQNEGFARPNNVGMARGKGRYLMLLNSDARLTAGSVGTLVQFLEEHPQAGACAPMLLYPDGSLQRSVKGFPSLETHLYDMLFLDKLFPRSRVFGKREMGYFDYDRTTAIDHAMAAAFLVRRELLTTVGPLDERFAIYYNDVDWCYRIRQQGLQIWYVPAAKVFHHLGKTVGLLNKDFSYFATLYDNVMLFYLKHYGRWAVIEYKLTLALGFVFRTVAWGIVSIVKPGSHARYMARFSAKSLLLGLLFWTPLFTAKEAQNA